MSTPIVAAIDCDSTDVMTSCIKLVAYRTTRSGVEDFFPVLLQRGSAFQTWAMREFQKGDVFSWGVVE